MEPSSTEGAALVPCQPPLRSSGSAQTAGALNRAPVPTSILPYPTLSPPGVPGPGATLPRVRIGFLIRGSFCRPVSWARVCAPSYVLSIVSRPYIAGPPGGAKANFFDTGGVRIQATGRPGKPPGERGERANGDKGEKPL